MVVKNKSRQVTALEVRLGPIIIGRVVIPSNEFPFDESYDKGKNIFGICKCILAIIVPSRESAGANVATRELPAGDECHRKALRRVPVALLSRVYLHQVGEERFCGTGDRRARCRYSP